MGPWNTFYLTEISIRERSQGGLISSKFGDSSV
jgi:hypothetical protein